MTKEKARNFLCFDAKMHISFVLATVDSYP